MSKYVLVKGEFSKDLYLDSSSDAERGEVIFEGSAALETVEANALPAPSEESGHVVVSEG